MTAIELLALLNAQGISLSVDGADLRISAPKGGLTDELRDALVRHKAELVELLGRQAAPDAAVPLAGLATEADGTLPLSFAQERLWFIEQLEPGTTVYNVPTAVRLRGALDVAALDAALNRLLQRHPVLRYRFTTRRRAPVAVVDEALTIATERVDCAGAGEDELAGKLTELTNLPFDLAAGPLLRSWLLESGKDDRILLLVLHHSITDGATFGILMQELAALYAEQLTGAPAALAELPAAYADFAAWQRRQMAGPELERQLEYWRGALQDAPRRLDLPTDKPRPATPDRLGGWVMERFPRELLEQLRNVARERRATLYMVLLAAFQVLLNRYSRQDDILTGTPVAGRTLSETEKLAGLFVNSVVIRSRFTQDMSFVDLLAQVGSASLDALNHQELPFERLVEDLQPERDPAVPPLFQVMFNLQSREHEAADFAGLDSSPVVVETGTAKFDLSVLVEDRSDGLAVWFEYSRDVYEEATAQRMLRHYGHLLTAIIDNPDSPVADLPLTDAAELEQLRDWNATAVDYPPEATLVSLFEAQVERTPDAPAVSFGTTTLTYAKLNARANKLARHLQTAGVTAETRVGVCMERSIEMVVALYGILKAGAAYVPLDPEYPAERLAHMLEDAAIGVILSQSHISDCLPAGTASVIHTNIGWEAIAIANCDDRNLPLVAMPEHAAYVIFTSGSTGRPKGVLNEHRGIVNRLLWMQDAFALDANDKVLQKTPYSFDVSVWEFFWPLQCGAELVVAEPGGHKDTAYLVNVIRERNITTLHFVPSMLRGFLQDPAAGSCSGLQRVICSGESLSGELRDSFFATLDAELHNLYGPTEAAIDVTWWPCDRSETSPIVPIGRPVSNTQIHIVDAAGRPCPVGVPGELLIGGVQVARGYVGRDELTAERFVADPFSGDKFAHVYRTGDLARWTDNGAVEFLGRLDFQVKLRGFRIELGEIEAALSAIDGITAAAVMLREDTPGDQRLAAYVVADKPADSETLRKALAGSLPDYMIPAAFVALDGLPLTASGKLDRNALPKPDWGSIAAVDYAPPRSPEEEALCEIWADVLSVPRIGIHDDFFRIGGHSLLAARLIARIRDTLDRELELRALFDRPTVAGLAAELAASQPSAGVPLQPREPGAMVPLSAAQQRLWILDQLDPGNCAWNIPWAVRLKGDINVDALQSAIDRLVERHESLRTRFVIESDGPVQRVDDDLRVRLQRRSIAPEALRDELTRLTRRTFALDTGPLFSVTLLEVDNREFALHVCMHHIIGDAWSTTVFMRELTTLYNAAASGTDITLPALSVQFPDYAVWQREYLRGASAEAGMTYWKQQLDGAPAVLTLPTDRPRPRVQTYAGAWHELRLPEALARRLRTLANDANATLFMVLLAAFDLLLKRYSGQDDIVVGTPVAGRPRSELENLIGFFVNTLVMRTHVDESRSFAELLHAVRRTALEAYAHQDTPFEQLVEELQPARDTSYAPLFQVMFIMQNAPAATTELKGIAREPLLFEFGFAKLDLTVSAQEDDGELVAYFEYNTDLFDTATIEQLARHYAALLENIAATPEAGLAELELLDEQEQRELVVTPNRTATAYPSSQPLHELFMQQAASTPDGIAVEYNGMRLGYRELDERSNALALQLSRLGAGADQRVAVCLSRSPDLIVALLGVLKSGSAWVPLDPDFPTDRLQYMLQDSAAKILVTERALAAVAEGLDLTTLQMNDQAVERSASAPAISVDPSQLAYVIYTSGSTGKPKGVAVEHRAVVNFLCSMLREPGIGPDDRLLAVTTLSFDISILEIFGPLLCGATVVLADRQTAADGFALARTLAEDTISIMQATPATWRLLLQTGWSGSDSLKILCGGEALDAELAAALKRCGREVWNMYGPTETTVWSTCERIATDTKLITVGKPLANTRCYVLDEQQRPVPTGVAGELCIGGDGVARGYLNRAELTAEKFVADPFHGGRMYRTGDLARWHRDGRLEVLGRTDFQVKLRGFRIELGEIESAVAGIDGIRQCVTLLREDTPGDQRLVAYFTARREFASQDELRAALRDRLPDYMLPAAFVQLDAFPLTPNGKVDRKQLPAPEWQAQQEYVAPRNELEQQLAAIWQDVLGVEQVGVYDDFFALGGHSLLATRLLSRILDETGREVPFMTLFNSACIDALARELDSRSDAGATAITRLPRDGRLPLSFAQQRLWFLDELSPGDPMYNIPWVMSVDGEPDRAALQSAIDAVVARHESLRTVFPNRDGEPLQVILPELALTLAEEDLTDDDELAVQRRLTELAQQRMNLAEGPLAFFTLLRTAEDEYLLAIVIHHIVFDAWSHGILLRELAACYNAARRNRRLELPPLAIEFADYAGWQRAWFVSEDFSKQLTYWTHKLDGAPTTLELPTDKPRPPVQTSNGANISRMLSQEAHDGIKALGEREGVSLFMTLLAAFNVLMSRYSGQDDLLVGTPVSGRKRRELEDILGFFLHTLVIRADLTGAPGFREFLARTRQTVLEAFENQELPFESLVEALDPERDTSRHPLFQVHFVLQHVDIDWEMFDGLRTGPVEFEFGTAKFDIMFFVFDANDKLSVRLEYNTDLFEAQTIERMIDHFEALLGGIIANPDERVDRLPLLPETERQTLLCNWNDTARDYPRDVTLSQLFEAQVGRSPDAIALQDGERRLTYAALDARINQLAQRLIREGVAAEVPVGVCMERSVEMVVALHAIVKAGGAYVPLDPDYPQQRLAHMLEDAELDLILVHDATESQLVAPAAKLINVDAEAAELETLSGASPGNRSTADNMAYIIFTSGSTGRPKGVVNEHRGICNRLLWMQETFALDGSDAVLQKTPFSFDVSVWEFFWPLLAGARLVIAKPGGHRDADYLCRTIAEHGITTLHFVPSMLQAFLQSPDVGNCSALRRVICSGEALAPELRNRFQATLSAELHNLYGPTEAAIDVTHWDCAEDSDRNSVPIGRPVANTRIYIVEPGGDIAPVGVAGELWIGGCQVARGYINRPELTAERFVRDPFAPTPGSRAYRTGDLARFNTAGAIEFLGRIDHQVKLRGFRIELGEIEAALDNTGMVEQSLVMLREDRDGDTRLVAYAVPSTRIQDAKQTAQWGDEQVVQWQDLWEETYSDPAASADPSDDFHSWNSSYTGEPIPLTEMREWLDNTVDGIAAVCGERALEIGSGSGLVAARIAPRVAHYTATDFSAASVQSLQQLCASRDELRHVRVLQCRADELDRLGDERFDTIILNSVAQYFPDLDYFVQVLRQAVAGIAGKGHLFVGDVRALPLLEAYHASVQAFQAAPDTPLTRLDAQVRQAVLQEEELLLDPELFLALTDEIPAITGVRFRLKPGVSDNELTNYRFDVMLEVGGESDTLGIPEQLHWQPETDLADLEKRLASLSAGSLLVTGIPNARHALDMNLLAAMSAGTDSTIAEALDSGARTAATAVEPDTLYRLGEHAGIDVQLVCTDTGRMNALFSTNRSDFFAGQLLLTRHKRPLAALANHPLTGKAQRQLVPLLRERLADGLPDYMVPADFVILDAFPLTPNGKVDRKALPAPDIRVSDTASYVAPRNALEEQLATIWTELLGLSQPGVNDNFFALGGHSLLATQLVSRIRDRLQVELPLLALFNHPTIAGLAAEIGEEPAHASAAAVTSCDRDAPLPLSFAQQRLWFLHKLEGLSSTYNVPLALRLDGRIDIGALQAAINELVARHEALRTTFAETAGTPVQVIVDDLDIPLQVRALAGADDEALQRSLEALVQTPFDLAGDALLRVHLLRAADDRNILLLLMHHIVSDGWSLGILARELAKLYEAHCNNTQVELPALPVQYADYAVWQRNWLQGSELQRQIGYWEQQLDGAPALLALPTDKPRPAVQTFNGAHINRTYSVELGDKLRALAGAEDCTLFMLLLAAYNVLLARYTGEDDIVVGTPIAGRTRSEIEGLIGFFVNTLVLRTDLSGDPDFTEVMRRARDTALAAYAHQELPFEKLVEELQPDRDVSHPPLFQTLFVLQENLSDDIRIHGTEVTPLDFELGSAKFDLSLFMVEFDTGLTASFEYNTDLFAAATIERMLTHLGTLLEAIADNPARPISELPLLDAAGRNQVLEQFNAPPAALPAARVHELVETQARASANAVAVVDGERQVSYAQLNARANRLARRLQSAGARPGTLVGICTGRGLQQVVSVLAVLKTGAAYVPIDPNYPRDRVAYMLDDSRAPVLITETAMCADLPAHQSVVVTVDDFDWDSGDDTNLNVAAGDSVYAIYTSGSTGLPKGVELTHTGLNNLIQWQLRQTGLDQPARTLQFASLSFDVSFQELFTTWAQGGTVVLVDEELRRDLSKLAGFIADQRIERLYLPFAALQPLAESIVADERRFRIRDVIVAGEQLQITPAVRRMFAKLDDARLHNQYGPSETHVVTAFTLSGDATDWMPLPPIGKAVANTRTYVLDSRLEPVPAGVPGELYLGGVQVARGYLQRPELTAERFIDDPFAEGRMYRTGDRVRFLPDGNLEYLGRSDDQVKWRGFRIEPGEIEAQLSAHEAVRQAAVMLREDVPGDKRLVAYVVTADNFADHGDELRSWLKARLPDYMVPSAFVTLDQMPLTPSGKVARRKLPLPDYADGGTAYVAPRTPLEETLVAIWSDVLGMAGTDGRIGIHDDFFALGGHSLLATQLLARVRSALDADLPLRELFDNPTVAGFAGAVERAAGHADLLPVTPAADATQPAPLSFAQQRLWFLDQLEPGNPVYNVPWAMRLHGNVNLNALQAAVDDMVVRHGSLRTVFITELGKAQQLVLETVSVEVETTDLRGAEQPRIDALLYELAREPFQLDAAPLMRVHLLQTGDDEHVLLIVLHHIISDGWSIGVLYRDLVRFYRGHCKGEAVRPPALPVQYTDYARWQQDWFESGAPQQQLDYWKNQLAGAPALLELPLDRPRGAAQTYNGGYVAKVLPGAIHDGLRDLARRENATLYMVCLAAFNVLLARYSGQTDISVGTPVAGRRHTELDELIGFFINTLVMRNDLAGEPGFSECIRRIRRTALEAFAHQDLPFEKLVDELHPVRDMSHAPLFQVAFILQNTPWDQSARLHNLDIDPLELDYGVAKFDLSLVMAERREGLIAHFEYNADLFDRATIERMSGHFETLLLAVIGDTDTPVAALPLLTAGERSRILYHWNDTGAAFADASCIHTLIENRTAQQPDAPAILFRDETLSYEALNARANRIAHYLIDRGAGPGTIVAISLRRSPDIVAAILGVFKAGAAYVPVDPDYPAERQEWMLDDSGAPLLITTADLLEDLPANSIEAVCLDTLQAIIAAQTDTNPSARATADDLAYVIYTSGSTGKPKGVMLEHRGVCNLADAQSRAFGLGPADRMLQFASMSFDASIFEIVMGLQVGAALVMAPQDDLLPGPALLDVLRRHEVTAVTLPPTALTQLPDTDLPALRTITVAGEACPPELVQRWATDRYRRFYNLYGPTEATVWASYARCLPGRRVTIGKPVSNARLYVLDNRLQPVPVGVPGELCIGGAGLARGYLHREQLTAEKFVDDPFVTKPGARIYRTGDLVRYLDDGNLEFLGRIDQQVKVRGFRIEPGEIEAALTQLDEITEAVVVTRGAHLTSRQLVAYVVPGPGHQLALGELRAALSAKLPEYMVPAAFVVMDAMPLTPNRKIDRNALPEPDENRLGIDIEYVAPRDAAETALADIWREVLGVSRVGINDNFFELGGDSILSIQIIARAGQAGLQLTPKQLFEHQTIAELAKAAGSERILAEQETLTGPVAMTPIQHWFAGQAGADARHFNQSQLLEASEPLDAELIDRALLAVVNHHDALRMTVERTTDDWQPRLGGTLQGQLVRLVKLKPLAAAEQARHELALANALQAGFDLANGPLIRGLLFRRGRGEPDRLLIAAHHMVIDWVSWNILLTDLQTAYRQLQAGEEPRLPLKTTSYRDWSEHLHRYANADDLQRETSWWTDQDWAQVRPLPLDHDAGDATEATTRNVTLLLSTEDSQRLLRELPAATRTGMDEILLTATAAALGNMTAASAVAINLEGHGREDLFPDADLSRTIGWFTSLYPVLLPATDANGLAHSLAAVKQYLRALPDRGVGFGVLRYLSSASATREALAGIPQPEVAFNFLGRLDRPAGETGLLEPCLDARGREISPAALRPHLLDIAIGVVNGQLQLAVNYSDRRHKRDTIAALVEDMAAQLRRLASECLDSGQRFHTPADFPHATIDQPALDRLLADSGAIDDLYRVTPLQHGMLFHSLLSAERDVYFASFGWRLAGELDAQLFEQAWQQVVERNSSLRTSFHWEGLNEPVQIVHRDVDVHMHRLDWSADDEADRARRLDNFLEQDRRSRFDFRQPPLMRLTLITLDAADHRFYWSFHHAVLDGWSVPLVLREVFAIYEAARAGRNADLPEPAPFSRYLEWLDRQDTAAAEAFWRDNLKGFAAPTPLPGARAQQVATGSSAEHGEYLLQVPAATVTALRSLARESRLTLNTVAQGVWALLLSRYSGERDVLFGATTSGRPAEMPGVGQMVGLFLNTLPARIDADPDAALLDWLQHLQDQQLEGRRFEFASLVEVQGWSEIPRGTQMFGSLLAFENYPDMETMWTSTDSITIREVDGFDRTNFPLTLNVAVFDVLQLRVVFDTRLYDLPAIEALAEHFRTLLEEIARDPHRLVGDIPMLTGAEVARYEDWNRTAHDYPRDDLMYSAVARHAQTRGTATAVECDSATLTYAELERRANQLAHRLLRSGAATDVPIGLCMDRSADMVVAMLAIQKAGSAYLPLDPAFPADRLRYMLEDAGAPALITHSRHAGLAAGLDIEVVTLDTLGAALEAESALAPDLVLHPEQLAYVIYTSGSTGKPKGVTVEHRAAVNFLHSMVRTPGIQPGDRLLAVTTLSFDISILEIFGPLTVGATVVLATPETVADGFALARQLSDAGISIMQATPATWRLLLQSGWQRGQSLRVLCGGEALDLELARQLAIPGHPVWNMYGPTETTIWSTCEAIECDAERITVGRPIANTRLYVLDTKLRRVPVGVVGELYIGGDGVARGYHERPELNRERFVANPVSAGSGIVYRTGDLARFLPDGRLEVLGRTDFQVKLRGYRIELGEIESLLAARDEITQCVLLLREDTPGDQRLVAYLTSSGDTPEREVLDAHLREALPDYMIPAAYVRLEEFPLTPNGKVDRNQLPAPEWTSAARYVAPRNATEELLAGIWQDILHVDQVGIHDDFFALGGHSLIAMQLVSRVLEQLRVEVPLDRLFAAPTVAALAQSVAQSVADSVSAPAGDVVTDSVNESRDSGAAPREIGRISRATRRRRRKSDDSN